MSKKQSTISCKFCGEPISPSALICPACFKDLSTGKPYLQSQCFSRPGQGWQPSTRTCAACKSEVAKGIAKCPHCGKKQPVTLGEDIEYNPGAVVFAIVVLVITAVFVIKLMLSPARQPTTPTHEAMARNTGRTRSRFASDADVARVGTEVVSARSSLTPRSMEARINAIMAGKTRSEQQVASGAIYGTILTDPSWSDADRERAVRYMVSRGWMPKAFAE